MSVTTKLSTTASGITQYTMRDERRYRVMKEPTPNYDIMFDSAVGSLRIAFSEYKKAVEDTLRWTFITNDGYFGILSGYEERQKKVEETGKEVLRLREVVSTLREKKGETYEHNGERADETVLSHHGDIL